MRIIVKLSLAFLLLSSSSGFGKDVPTVVYPKEASFAERLAAREVRRYLYLRTGKLSPLVSSEELIPPSSNLILLGRQESKLVGQYANNKEMAGKVGKLTPQGFLLKTLNSGGRAITLVIGGDEIGTLYGAYRFVEHLDVRFYLHGDVIPDKPLELPLLDLDETEQPLFNIRGINSWGSHSEGMDLWGTDEYKAIVAQLAKMRMNFIGIHGYAEGKLFAEPLVWTGLREDFDESGRVKLSYPASWFNTSRTDKWGYKPKRTSDYNFGGSLLFDRNDWGSEIMRDLTPEPQTPAACNELFNRVGVMLAESFQLARLAGVKTCVGLEMPIVIPAVLRKKLAAMGKNPSDPVVVQEVYEGIFRRIQHTHPLDYYWLWTPENWTWEEVKDGDVQTVLDDLSIAIKAAKNVNPRFKLATAGWVLGPSSNRTLFDATVPKNIPFSALSRQFGKTPVDAGFAQIRNRSKWAIPWMEDDPNLLAPQLWVGRTRKDAADALRYGCDGLIGLHWRTRILGPNLAALAQAGWSQNDFNLQSSVAASRILSSEKFYQDWAVHEFGPEAGPQIAEVFARVDSRLPESSAWMYGGAGGLRPLVAGTKDPASGTIVPDLREAETQYAFVDQLERFGNSVKGEGNLERFHYWLLSFGHMRAQMRVQYAWGEFEQKVKELQNGKDLFVRKRRARAEVLPLYRRLMQQVMEAYGYLLASINTQGEFGTLMNWEQHNGPYLLDGMRREAEQMLGEPVPLDALPHKEYTLPTRIIVPTLRGLLTVGEGLKLKVIIMSHRPPVKALLYWRPLGIGVFREVALSHIKRGVYRAILPASQIQGDDFEYYIEASTSNEAAHFPATAPALCQTVVVMDSSEKESKM